MFCVGNKIKSLKSGRCEKRMKLVEINIRQKPHTGLKKIKENQEKDPISIS